MSRYICFLTLLLLLLGSSFFCGVQETAAQQPLHEFVTLIHDGIERSFYIHVPASHDPAESSPLLIALHGRSSSGLAMAATTGLDSTADEAGFIVVYPNSAGHNWGEDTTLEDNVDDVGFIEALIDYMVEEYAVNADRVFLTGFHNGGLMAYRLACEIPERFESVAVVGPLMYGYQRDACPQTAAAPVNMLILHGDADPLYQTETYIFQPLFDEQEYLILGVDDTLKFWTERNGCATEATNPDPISPEATNPDPASTETPTANVRVYALCDENTTVALYTIQGGKTNWPRIGDYALNQFGLDASQMVSQFFMGNEDWAAPQPPYEGQARTYTLYVPTTYDPEKPAPLVITLHGRFGSGASTAAWIDMNRVAEENGFIALYPDGLNDYNPEYALDTGWNYLYGIPGVRSSETDDAAFLRDLIADLSVDLHIDQQRVYVMGISNGGFMVHALACNDPGQYAAFADVIGSASLGFDTNCDHSLPVPMLLMHGTLDNNILWDGNTEMIGGQEMYTSYPIAVVMGFWGSHNGCDLDNVESVDIPQSGLSPGTQVRIITLADCTLDAKVVLYGIIGGGHNWPGSAEDINDSIQNKINMDIDAAEVIWEFFSAYSRAEAVDPGS